MQLTSVRFTSSRPQWQLTFHKLVQNSLDFHQLVLLLLLLLLLLLHANVVVLLEV
jgi:hypothetical protein